MCGDFRRRRATLNTPEPKFGNTNPVINCARHHRVDEVEALHTVDYFIRGFRSKSHEDIVALAAFKFPQEAINDFAEIASRVIV